MISYDIYKAQSLKAMDEGCGIDTAILMERAAERLFELLKDKNRLGGNICILCGKGNNGGDGYALGVLLLKNKCKITVVSIDAPSSPLAVRYKNAYTRLGGDISTDRSEAIARCDTVVDCIFGFSFKGSLEGKYADAVDCINKSEAFVLAADVPSGITSDSCVLPALCVRADCTCTFTAPKVALSSYPAAKACGEVTIADIGIPKDIIDKHTPFAIKADGRLLGLLPKRPTDGHKGTFGTLAALCGNSEMCGAAYMATLAALKSGVGIVRLYTDELCALVTKTRIAEAVISSVTTTENILSHSPTALLIGCGCGRSYDGTIKDLILKTHIPVVIDADGINCIAPDIQLYRSIKSEAVVTPHPAEMGRLLGISTAEVNADRIGCAVSFAKEYGFVTVLKGARTIIAAPDGRVCISYAENTGLAKGGSGDVLAGLVASLLAQGMDSFYGACLGVYLHGAAAERLAKQKGVYAMLPSELPDMIGQIMYFG